VHERALLEDLLRKVIAVAEAEGATAVTRIRVRLGALSHYTPEHFREHWEDASRGTLAEGAEAEARMDAELTGDAAQGVVLESVEVSGP
jgi:hydrogenase nickel incorporation protein HypA/HybF